MEKVQNQRSREKTQTKRERQPTKRRNDNKAHKDKDDDLEEIQKLANEVSMYAEDKDKKAKIIALLKKMEPGVKLENEVEVSNFKPPTIIALRELVESFCE